MSKQKTVEKDKPANAPVYADAVLFPKGTIATARAVTQHQIAYRTFGPVCNCKAFWFNRVNNSWNLGIPRSHVKNFDADLKGRIPFTFENGHPRAGEGRYEWYSLVPIDGTYAIGEPIADPFADPLPKAGFLKPGALDEDPEAIRGIEAERERAAEIRTTMFRTIAGDAEFTQKLKEKTGASDAELERLFSIYDRPII